MHASTIATAGRDQGASTSVQAAVVPVISVAIIGIVIIRPIAGGVLG